MKFLGIAAVEVN